MSHGAQTIVVTRGWIARAGGVKAALDEGMSLAALRMTPRAMTAYEAVGSTPTEEDGAAAVVQIVVRNEEELREAIGAGAEAVLIEGVSGRGAAVGGDCAGVAGGLRGGSEGRGDLTQRARRKSTEGISEEIVGCHGPSTSRPDAPQNGAEERAGPLRSG